MDAQTFTYGQIWLDVRNGNDGNGRRDNPKRSFKTFEGAYNAMVAAGQEWNQINVLAHPRGGNIPLNATSAITISTSCIVKSTASYNNLSQPQFNNCSITIDNNTRRPIVFLGIVFYADTLDDYLIKINRVSDHGAEFQDCYIITDHTNRKCIYTVNEWLVSGSTGAAGHRNRVLFKRTAITGHCNFNHGTPGDPYSKKGVVIFDDTDPQSVGGSVASGVWTINSGVVNCNNNAHSKSFVLNGGLLYLKDCLHPAATTTNPDIIIANDTATPGNSILIIDGYNALDTGARSPIAEGNPGTSKITIGNNVVYSISGLLDPSNLIINAGAKHINQYLVDNGKTLRLVDYNETRGNEGYATFTVTTADVTLTNSQSSNDWIETTGVLTGNRVVFLPLKKGREYTVTNSCTGAFTLTFKSSSGTGPAVTQTKTCKIKCNGTNWVKITGEV